MGWYLDPRVAGQDRYWDGRVWTAQTRPSAVSGAPISPPPSRAVAAAGSGWRGTPQSWIGFGVLLLAAIGWYFELQPVSLLTGDSSLITGAVLVGIACVVAFAARMRTWIQVIAIVMVVGSVVYPERQLSDRRAVIQQDLSALGGN